MAQVLAGIFLALIIVGVAKMVIDVQIAKLERTVEELKEHFDKH
jgi:hypothetical protein